MCIRDRGVQGDGTSGAIDPWTSSATSTEAQITDSTVSNYEPSTTNPYWTADAASTQTLSPVNNSDKGYCRVTEGT